METITIKFKNSSDASKILELLKKQSVKMEISKVEQNKKLSDEEILDKGLLRAMEEGKKTKFVAKSSIMKKLKRNESKISPKV